MLWSRFSLCIAGFVFLMQIYVFPASHLIYLTGHISKFKVLILMAYCKCCREKIPRLSSKFLSQRQINLRLWSEKRREI